ncbi:MAG: hypothetical protein LBJ69_01085 [Holosporales bacterium]|jgi:hypothetical protein|nr:hypothetical protein [Holosporales bacterium]
MPAVLAQATTAAGKATEALDELGSSEYGLEKIMETVGRSSDEVTVSTLHGRIRELSELVGHPRLVKAANPPTVPNAVITPETGLYFAMSEMFRWHMANMQTEELLAHLPDPLRMRWARRAIAAFLIARMRTLSAVGIDVGRDAPWYVGRSIGSTEEPRILVSTIHYEAFNRQNGEISGWIIVKNGTNTTLLMKDPTDVATLLYDQQAVDYVTRAIERFETEATIPHAYDFSVFESNEVVTYDGRYGSPLPFSAGAPSSDDIELEGRMHQRCTSSETQWEAVSYCMVHLPDTTVNGYVDKTNIPINIDQQRCYAYRV